MANTVIALKKSATPSSAPTNLANGELAINYADGKLYYKAANGTIASISGNEPNYFGSVSANGTLLVADMPSDILTMTPGDNISIVGDAINDKVTIGLKNDVTIPGLLTVSAASGDEGGEIRLANAVTSSVLAGPVNIDIYQNKLRFFVGAGDARGAFINLAATAAGVGTDLLAAASSTDTVARATAGQAFDKANAALPNVSGSWFNGTLTASGNLSADKVTSSNNGYGENFKVGDDVWLGDYNNSNSLRIKGQQNASIAYINFGIDDLKVLGRSGTGPLTYDGQTVWHAGNDGIGSGLDADLLDGQHGSYYGIASDVTAAFLKANTANITADRAWNHANAAFITANIAFANANTVMVSAQAAFTVANSSFLHANAAYTFANSISLVANAAFLHANAAFANANTVMVSAQVAFTVANSSFIHANSGYAFANSIAITANLAFAHANLAFANGNTVIQTAQSAFNQANLSYLHANAAYASANAGQATANAAFANANTVMVSAQAAFTVANSGFIHANAGYAFANSIAITANLAFAHANSAYANGNIVIQTAQSAFTQANLSFLHANAAHASANAGMAIGNGAFASANAGQATANAAFANANTVMISAQAAFTVANSSFLHANAGYAFANSIAITANLAFAHANLAFANGNTVIQTAQSAFNQANLSFLHANGAHASANAGMAIGNGAFASANAGQATANVAFNRANTANITADRAWNHANAAFANANTVMISAQAAFTVANSGFIHANAAFLSSNGVNTYSDSTYVKLIAASQTITGSLAITGNLSISGNTTFVNAENLTVSDPLIYLAGNNYTSDILDIGFVANYVNATGSNVHTGFFRDATIKEYYLFEEYNKEPNPNHIDTAANNFAISVLNATIKTSNLILGGTNTIPWITASFNHANAAHASANAGMAIGNAAFASANAGQATANAAFTRANTANITADRAWNHANAAFATINSAFGVANTALANTSGVSFNGNLNFPTGNVGIGTASPSARLSVSDSAVPKMNFLVGAIERAFISYTESTSIARIDSDAILTFCTNNTESARIDASGNVGIGTTTPTHKFQVGGTSYFNGATKFIAGTWHVSDDNKNRFYYGTNGRTYFGSGDGSYEFRNSSDAGVIFIGTAGDLGIANNNPQAKLHVSGTGAQARWDAGAAADARHEYYRNNIREGYINWDTNVISLAATQASGNVTFLTGSSPTERVRITNAGTVGIGTTTPEKTLDINGTVLVRSENADAIRSRFIAGKASPGTGNGALYLQYGYSDFVQIGNGTTASDFYVARGNVGIGTTSPAYTLQVAGSFAAQTKSFVINHPTKSDMKLRYGSLEGPENGVYVRGRVHGPYIYLPDYWLGLVDEHSITVSLTPIAKTAMPSVLSWNNEKIVLHSDSPIDCFYYIIAERKDVEKLVVEY